ncbi:MAG: M15 family metallopeptidase, partial [bacterium]
ITVNAQIASSVQGLLNKSTLDGIRLTGGGFRTMQQQISLRTSNGCPNVYDAPAESCATPTARPGYSNHQMGLAIDFSSSGSLIRSSSSSGFIWLNANAISYGLKNLPSEPWHWSVDGS